MVIKLTNRRCKHFDDNIISERNAINNYTKTRDAIRDNIKRAFTQDLNQYTFNRPSKGWIVVLHTR